MSYGRQKIYSDAKIITAENVVDEVNKAHATHVQNQADIRKLWEYYRGKTTILTKTKINNKKGTKLCPFIYFASNLSQSLVAMLLPALISEIFLEISSANFSFTAKVTATLSE